MTATAVVTGAATGIGSAPADALADAGYAVALWDIDEAAVKAGAAEIAARDGRPSRLVSTSRTPTRSTPPSPLSDVN